MAIKNNLETKLRNTDLQKMTQTAELTHLGIQATSLANVDR